MEHEHRIRRVAIYLRKSRNNEGEETEETLAKHRKRCRKIQLGDQIVSKKVNQNTLTALNQ